MIVIICIIHTRGPFSPSAANVLEEKYEDLLSIVGDMSREVKPAYTGNKASVERLKKSK